MTEEEQMEQCLLSHDIKPNKCELQHYKKSNNLKSPITCLHPSTFLIRQQAALVRTWRLIQNIRARSYITSCGLKPQSSQTEQLSASLHLSDDKSSTRRRETWGSSCSVVRSNKCNDQLSNEVHS